MIYTVLYGRRGTAWSVNLFLLYTTFHFFPDKGLCFVGCVFCCMIKLLQDTTSTVPDQWACMFRIVSKTLHSAHFSLSITLVEITVLFKFKPGIWILIADEWFASCAMLYSSSKCFFLMLDSEDLIHWLLLLGEYTQLLQWFCHQLLLFSSADMFDVKLYYTSNFFFLGNFIL